jgi:hypothetical protein
VSAAPELSLGPEDRRHQVIFFDRAGRALARFLTQERHHPLQASTSQPVDLARALRKGDVLLIDGNTRISVAIKYLTQSSWSHAALYIGDALGPPSPGHEPEVFIEADPNMGVHATPLSRYVKMHTRICRPVGLSAEELDQVVHYAVSRLGRQYDLRQIWDLARYLLPTPPVPSRWRRRLLALGSADPTRAICSTLIAEAFQSVGYPILPKAVLEREHDPDYSESAKELRHIHERGLFMPRDFDVSPYFEVVKPTLQAGFDPHQVTKDTEVVLATQRSAK